MECNNMLLHRCLRLEVVWLADAMWTSQSHLLKVRFNLSTDCVIVVRHHHLVSVYTEVVEPSVLAFSQRASASWVLELKAKTAVSQMVVYNHQVSGAFLVTLLPTLNSKNTGLLKLTKSSQQFGMRVEASDVINHFGMEIVFRLH